MQWAYSACRHCSIRSPATAFPCPHGKAVSTAFPCPHPVVSTSVWAAQGYVAQVLNVLAVDDTNQYRTMYTNSFKKSNTLWAVNLLSHLCSAFSYNKHQPSFFATTCFGLIYAAFSKRWIWEEKPVVNSSPQAATADDTLLQHFFKVCCVIL